MGEPTGDGDAGAQQGVSGLHVLGQARQGARARRQYATVNPATGTTVKTYREMPDADVERCPAAALAAHEG
jgi:acyl-CoA reductase-like NAD-dependent aldehyde dehydrogenase